MLGGVPTLLPSTTSVVPATETADELVAVEVCPPTVWTEVDTLAGEPMVLLPITRVPLAPRDTGVPETVTADPPGLRVVPAIAIAVGFAVKV